MVPGQLNRRLDTWPTTIVDHAIRRSKMADQRSGSKVG